LSTLALLGGKPTLEHPLAPYNSMGEEEVIALARVARSGKLSCFIGAWCDDFDG
jgi:hypothetical protein